MRVGLHYATLDAFLSGNATVNGNLVANARSEIDDCSILPNIGAFGNYARSDKWLVSVRIDWLSASIRDYSGSLWNTEFGVQYQAFGNVGIGLAYRYVLFEIEQQESSPGDWHAEQRFAGPSLFITANC